MLVVGLAIYSVYYLIRLSNYCKSAIDFVQLQNKNSVSLRRMAAVESSLTDLTDSYDQLLASHRKLRSRMGMRKLRSDSKEQLEIDPGTMSDANKSELKKKLRLASKANGLLR